MFVAGIDAHTTYSVVAVVSNAGKLVHKPVRIPNSEPDRLLSLLEGFRPLEAVVETCPTWPWLFDLLQGSDIPFVLAHAKRLRAIADSTGTSPCPRRTPSASECDDGGIPQENLIPLV